MNSDIAKFVLEHSNIESDLASIGFWGVTYYGMPYTKFGRVVHFFPLENCKRKYTGVIFDDVKVALCGLTGDQYRITSEEFYIIKHKPRCKVCEARLKAIAEPSNTASSGRGTAAGGGRAGNAAPLKP